MIEVPMELKVKLLQSIKSNHLIASGSTVIVGISGGPDSIALAHALIFLRPHAGFNVHLAHYNHKARALSDADQRFVERFAKDCQVSLTVGCRPKGPIKKISEDQARQLRFAFFARVCKKLKTKTVALGHTQDDAGETILMRLMRGAGLYGLRGILPQRTIDGIDVVRPLLSVSRHEVMAYLKAHRLTFRVDDSNHTDDYSRNKVRRKLLPLMARDYNPNIAGVLLDLAQMSSDDYDFLAACANQRFKENVVSTKGTVKISLPYLQQEHAAMRRLLIRQMVQKLGIDPGALAFDHVRAVEHLIDAPVSKGPLHLPQGLRVAVKNKMIVVSLCKN